MLKEFCKGYVIALQVFEVFLKELCTSETLFGTLSLYRHPLCLELLLLPNNLLAGTAEQ
jgi:hypothetical protein